MRNKSSSIVVAAALLTLLAGGMVSAAPPEAAAAAVILDSLVVRVYDTAGILAAERSRAISRAETIVSRADIAVEWIDCPARQYGKPSPLCAVPAARGELVVRLVDAPSAEPVRSKLHALGYSMIDSTTGTGALATVFVDRVTALARSAQIDRATVLGRAIAHEIGHLILGSNQHTRDGIMRETWTAVELMNGRAKDWMFLPAQAEQMRQARMLGASGAAAAATPRRKSSEGG